MQSFFKISISLFLAMISLCLGAQSIEINLDADKLTKRIEDQLMEQNREGQPAMAVVSLPWFDGAEIELLLQEASQFAPALQAQYPDIRSYRVVSTDGSRSGRLNTSPRGVFMVLLGGDGPVGILHNNDTPIPTHTLERIDMASQYAALGCNVEHDHKGESLTEGQRIQANSCFQFGATLRRFRLALACTGEFANNNGGTVASVNVAYNNRIAELNAIYEVDAAITFQLIAGNDVLISLNPTTDPFSDPGPFPPPMPSNDPTSLNEGEAHIESLINDADYDIGHSIHDVVGGGGISGLAGVGVVCVNGAKARGWSMVFNGSNLAILQHEIGHQFSCTHTNYGCSSTNGNTGTQRYEPGRGNTIMNPGNIATCAGANTVNPISSSYFNVASLVAIENHIASTGNCFTSVATGNGAPSSYASAASGNTIPANTAFILEGGGSDPDGTSLTYCWEQYDTGSGTGDPTATANSIEAPLFRSNEPSSSPNRYFPKLSTILSGTTPNGSDGEILPAVSRTLNFRLTTRDGTTGNACDQTAVSVVNTGASFAITSQNTATTWAANGTNTATVTWNIAGTTANGINTSNVDIFLSTDGGNTFGFTIATATANDGSHSFTIPAFATVNGRVMVRGSGNIFLDINDAPITITVGGSCAAAQVPIAPATPVSAPAGDASLDLGLSPGYGNQLSSPFALVVDVNDPTGVAVLEDGATNACTTFNGNNYYQVQDLYAGSNSTYTFTSSRSNTTGVFIDCATLFDDSYQGNCTSYLGATKNINGNVSSQSFMAAMNTSTKYELVGFGINGSTTGNVDVSFSGGTLFDGIPNPGAGFFYTYGIINDATGDIVAFDPSADLSNASNFPAGSYTVFGASVENGTNLTPYIGGTKANFVNASALQTICARVSTNEVDVTVEAPLPVELVSFVGQTQDTGNFLTWASASERGTAYYSLERQEPSGWVSLGEIETKGEASAYSLLDPTIRAGKYYYRLAMVEFDGSVAYSDIVALQREASIDKSFSVYPNPSRSGDITLAWTGFGNIETVEIHDAIGRLVFERSSASTFEKSVQMKTGLSAGTYTVTVQFVNRQRQSTRMVIVP